MSWADQAQGVRTAQIQAFGLAASGLPLASLQPAAGGLPVDIDGVFEEPAIFEDVFPASSQGVSVIRFWVDIDNIAPRPQRGDTIAINGVTYDINDVKSRPEGSASGGATLMLRRKS